MSSSEHSLKDYLPILSMAGLILIVQVLSLLLSTPMETNNMQAFEDPTQVSNSIYYIIMILAFTLVVLIAIKKNMKWIISLFIYLAILSTLYYVFFALFSLIPSLAGFEDILSVLISTGLTVLLYKYPEWYIIDILGVCIAGGVSALIGISLSIIPVVILLILLAVYDAISVYKTKHMITMAEGIMDLKLPILFIIPKHPGYSFIKETFKEGEKREAFFMGLGDAVMPTLLVVSANVFIENGGFSYPVLGAILGTLAGHILLSIVVMKGKPQAGLPFLNTGAILGFFAGVLISGASIL
ncbi:MAG: presenilin family intramembrane aspartyl protease PSH [Methanosarcina sp.]|uniref:presenilin family intramembrane aspartyl protease PSH n=1 Tax=Methanosarcina sp. TaxID=2213 RepID=UPI002C6B5C8B|nr:presenilin family intramembrane aspartyl protease PSH [Methanosarcina sp.]MDM7920507.1 presenilin family intramembrane aspartyl protease PSH [Methanosarcina sp.]HOW14834.1 presenilin family intramembrane aspartyl protease PSH [Methanosarcina sp.]